MEPRAKSTAAGEESAGDYLNAPMTKEQYLVEPGTSFEAARDQDLAQEAFYVKLLGVAVTTMGEDGALDGFLSEFVSESGYRARRFEVLEFPTHRKLPARSIVLVGLGSKDSADADAVRRGAAAAAKRLKDRRILASALHQEIEGSTSAAAEGFLLGIISRADIIRAMTRSDADIGREVIDAIEVLGPENLGDLEVSVKDGIVTLTGGCDRKSTRDIAVSIASPWPEAGASTTTRS